VRRDAAQDGRNWREGCVEVCPGERHLAARLGRDAGGTVALTSKARVVLDANARVPMGVRRPRAVAREHALERRPGDGAPEILVVMQPSGAQDPEQEYPGDDTNSKPARMRHPASTLGQTPSSVKWVRS
jgi:hypothetical protein